MWGGSLGLRAVFGRGFFRERPLALLKDLGGDQFLMFSRLLNQIQECAVGETEGRR